MRIIGIDPGSLATGYGIIDSDGRDSRPVDCGVIRLREGELPQKLGRIFSELVALVERWQPGAMAIENVFLSRNAGSALKLGQARGAAICAGVHCGLPVSEYSPRAVKLAVVGTGGADKDQVQHMVKMLLNLQTGLPVDASDALAIALTHAHTGFTQTRLDRMQDQSSSGVSR